MPREMAATDFEVICKHGPVQVREEAPSTGKPGKRKYTKRAPSATPSESGFPMSRLGPGAAMPPRPFVGMPPQLPVSFAQLTGISSVTSFDFNCC